MQGVQGRRSASLTLYASPLTDVPSCCGGCHAGQAVRLADALCAPTGLTVYALVAAGSMQGARETVAKAVAVECMRGAHRQGRACFLYAFSGPGQVRTSFFGCWLRIHLLTMRWGLNSQPQPCMSRNVGGWEPQVK
jgi:hypothetical protein